ncbi:MAG: hypothetical protein KC502_13990 [Myxococcales bacterium]|nr:hypothetical protein [Myxococcales bacterium]
MADDAPDLGLDFEERIFGRLWRWYKARRAVPPPTGAVAWQDMARRLSIIASVFAGRPVQVKAAEGIGGSRGASVLVPQPFVLPLSDRESGQIHGKQADLAADISAAHERLTAEALVLRVVVGGAMLQGKGPPSDGAGWRADLQRTLATLDEELAGFAVRRAAIAAQLPEGTALWGGPLTPEAGGVNVDGDLPEGDAPPPVEGGDEIDGGARDDVRVVSLDEEAAADAVPMPAVEQVQTLDSYKGGRRTLDGSDELSDHEDALEEVDLREMFRGGAGVSGVYRVDVDGFFGIPDIDGETAGGIPYDEWDVRKGAYKPGWVKVFPARHTTTDPAWAADALHRRRSEIRRVLADIDARLRTRRLRGRQLDGADIDLAAIVAAHADRRAGRTPDPRIYQSPRPRQRDLAVTVLLDRSLSSGAWIEGERVLDLERDACLVLGEVAWNLGDDLQILAFASHTRHRCEVVELKGWRDNWPAARARLGTLAPRGYTRLGPAVRHASRSLARQAAHDRLLLIITDGKPTDHDRYEGRHGLADVRQAVREATGDGISVHALCIAPSAAPLLSAQFGAGRWTLLRHGKELPMALGSALARWHVA